MPAPFKGNDLVDVSLGYPVYLGTIDATTTAKTNAEATTPFANSGELLKGKVLAVHNAGAVDVRIALVATSTGDVTSTRDAAGFGWTIKAGDQKTFRVGSTLGYLSVITVSSTANFDVFELL